MIIPEAVKPTIGLKDSYVEALREGFRSIQATPEQINWIDENFGEYLRQEDDPLSRPEWWQPISTSPIQLADGTVSRRVPCTTLWLVVNNRFIGEVAVRHELTPDLQQVGGHIGFNVRKSERNKGYGTQLLQIGLKEARRLGLDRVLVTCNDDNIGSIKIIEGANGQLTDKITIPGRPTPHRHYWIRLGPSSEPV